jgi:hypothetical protein
MKDRDAHAKLVAAGPNVHRYTKPVPPRHEPDEGQAFDSFAEARAQSRDALMLDLKLASGRILSFPYSSLEFAEYLPTGTIHLRFRRHEAMLDGKNMHRLRELITEHRVRFVQEGTDIERGLKPEDAAHIDHIEISEVEDL